MAKGIGRDCPKCYGWIGVIFYHPNREIKRCKCEKNKAESIKYHDLQNTNKDDNKEE